MTRYKVSSLHDGSMVTDPTGDWVPYSQVEDIQRENDALRKQVDRYQRIHHYQVLDECELEVALEKCGVVFYDDYGHRGMIDPTVEFIENLKKGVDK